MNHYFTRVHVFVLTGSLFTVIVFTIISGDLNSPCALKEAFSELEISLERGLESL